MRSDAEDFRKPFPRVWDLPYAYRRILLIIYNERLFHPTSRDYGFNPRILETKTGMNGQSCGTPEIFRGAFGGAKILGKFGPQGPGMRGWDTEIYYSRDTSKFQNDQNFCTDSEGPPHKVP